MKARLFRPLIALPLVVLAAVQSGTITHHASAAVRNPYAAILRAEGNAAPTVLSNYHPTSDDGCPKNRGSNIKVNQDCLNISDSDLQGRAQAKDLPLIAANPNNPDDLVAVYNDYRRGDSTCGSSYSRDGGQSWQDSTVPTGFTRGDFFGAERQYWQAGGVPAVGWDTRDDVYQACELFQRGKPPTTNPDLSSGIYVFRSTHNKGASWNFPARPVAQVADLKGAGIGSVMNPSLAVDTNDDSPYRDRVYVAWQAFASNGFATIYAAYSDDYGETFSTPVLLTGTSSLCPMPVGGTPNACDNNGLPQIAIERDGAVYVVFTNFNNAVSGNENRDQILIAKSTDGGGTFGPLVQAAYFYDLPDCATYEGGQDAGATCVPEKSSANTSFFVAFNYPVPAANPTEPQQLVITYGSYINQHSNEANGCAPAGRTAPFGNNLYSGVKTPGACNNDILYSVSNDGGQTFTGTGADPRAMPVVTTAPDQATTDQFWQWSAFSHGGRLAVGYYDRQYGKDETDGFSDMSLSASRNLKDFDTVRVTTSSMPPTTQFSGLFEGINSGLAVSDERAHLVWTDTRDPDLFLCPGTGKPGVPPDVCRAQAPGGGDANTQDIYTANLPLPGS